MKKAKPDKRRDFLKLAAVTGSAVAAGSVANRTIAAQPEEKAAETAPASKGYHVSEHVKQYYDKARF